MFIANHFLSFSVGRPFPSPASDAHRVATVPEQLRRGTGDATSRLTTHTHSHWSAATTGGANHHQPTNQPATDRPDTDTETWSSGCEPVTGGSTVSVAAADWRLSAQLVDQPAAMTIGRRHWFGTRAGGTHLLVKLGQ